MFGEQINIKWYHLTYSRCLCIHLLVTFLVKNVTIRHVVFVFEGIPNCDKTHFLKLLPLWGNFSRGENAQWIVIRNIIPLIFSDFDLKLDFILIRFLPWKKYPVKVILKLCYKYKKFDTLQIVLLIKKIIFKLKRCFLLTIKGNIIPFPSCYIWTCLDKKASPLLSDPNLFSWHYYII